MQVEKSSREDAGGSENILSVVEGVENLVLEEGTQA